MIKASLLYSRAIVFDISEARELYKSGFYGKPLGNPKPKSPEDINTPLELSLFEALYLQRKGILEVYSRNAKLTTEELYKYSKELIPRFELLYRVYSDLRNKGYVVRSGIKYGADFAIYTLGPGIEHAPYLVLVIDSTEKLKSNELLSYGRVSHSTRKELILAFTNLKNDEISYIIFKWHKL
ncbi:MAG: tRNA-intron lyase [Sulfolobaceae archaeon]|nr:tRNA-intron lyase [Sulfolobaceae archaeon]